MSFNSLAVYGSTYLFTFIYFYFACLSHFLFHLFDLFLLFRPSLYTHSYIIAFPLMGVLIYFILSCFLFSAHPFLKSLLFWTCHLFFRASSCSSHLSRASPLSSHLTCLALNSCRLIFLVSHLTPVVSSFLSRTSPLSGYFSFTAPFLLLISLSPSCFIGSSFIPTLQFLLRSGYLIP